MCCCFSWSPSPAVLFCFGASKSVLLHPSFCYLHHLLGLVPWSVGVLPSLEETCDLPLLIYKSLLILLQFKRGAKGLLNLYKCLSKVLKAIHSLQPLQIATGFTLSSWVKKAILAKHLETANFNFIVGSNTVKSFCIAGHFCLSTSSQKLSTVSTKASSELQYLLVDMLQSTVKSVWKLSASKGAI